MNEGSHGSDYTEGPVITAHSLPDVDHAVSMNIVTNALSSLLADQDPVSPDSGYHDKQQVCVILCFNFSFMMGAINY